MSALLMDVIVPFHGHEDLLARCLAALAGTDPIGGRLYLVDDGSPRRHDPRARAALASLGLPIEWVVLERRCGFVAAVNHAWQQCRAPLTLLLNSDVIVQSDMVRRLRTCLTIDGRLAAVAPASDNPADLFQYRPDGAACGATEVPYLTAACLAVRRGAVAWRPLLDPAYAPGYFEDLDLCCRLRAGGWKLALIEGSKIQHSGRATFRDEPHLDLLVRRNYDMFLARWGHLSSQADLEPLLWGREAACR